MTKSELFEQFLYARLFRAMGRMVINRNITDDEAIRLLPVLRCAVGRECTSKYDWIELCDIMNWKRRNVSNPETDYER